MESKIDASLSKRDELQDASHKVSTATVLSRNAENVPRQADTTADGAAECINPNKAKCEYRLLAQARCQTQKPKRKKVSHDLNTGKPAAEQMPQRLGRGMS